MNKLDQLDQLAAGALIRARPWDVVGVGLAAPMVVWGFLGWFGTVGDSGSGQPGFFSGAGAAGIALLLAASSITVNQVLQGRPHERTGPPVAVLLAASGALIVLGGMIAKPDSATLQAGSVAGLLTALSQAVALTLGWLRGSEKTVKAANVRAMQAQQAAADAAAAQLARAVAYQAPGYPSGYGAPSYGVPGYGGPGYGGSAYGAAGYGAPVYGAPGYGAQPVGGAGFGSTGGYPTAPQQTQYGQVPSGQAPYGQASWGQPPRPAQYPTGQPGPYPPAGPGSGAYPSGQDQPVQYPRNRPPGQYPYEQGAPEARTGQYPAPGQPASRGQHRPGQRP